MNFEFEPGDIVELIDRNVAGKNKLRAEVGARALVYSIWEDFVHVVWIDKKSNGQIDGGY